MKRRKRRKSVKNDPVSIGMNLENIAKGTHFIEGTFRKRKPRPTKK